MISAVASLIMLSPSTTVTTRRGTRSRWAIAVAAIGSVGETIAPSTTAAFHESPAIAAWATAATPNVVAITSPIASNEIGLTFSRRSRSEEKKAAE